MEDVQFTKRKRNLNMWSGMEIVFNGEKSDKLKYLIMFINKNKSLEDKFDVFAVEVGPGISVTDEEFTVDKW